MPLRSVLVACLAVPLLLAQPVLAKEKDAAATAKDAAATAKDAAATAKEPSVTQSAARARQKACGAEWRALSVADKAAKGPKWPQYYSKCVKRLKEQKA